MILPLCALLCLGAAAYNFAGPPVSLLHLCAQLLHRDQAAHAEDEVVHKLVRSLSIQQRTHHLQAV